MQVIDIEVLEDFIMQISVYKNIYNNCDSLFFLSVSLLDPFHSILICKQITVLPLYIYG